MSQQGEVTVEMFYNAMHADDLERVREVWRHASATGLPYELEYRAMRPDGSVRWVNARGRGYYDEAGDSQIHGSMTTSGVPVPKRGQRQEQATPRQASSQRSYSSIKV